MYRNGNIWMGMDEQGNRVSLLANKATRHGLIAGATGSGKTVSLKVMAEAFSEMGVPVFMADVKGDLAGLIAPGEMTDDLGARIEKFALAEEHFQVKEYPVTFWDLFGENGIPLRTTISEMGPLLLARIMGLNELQTNLLSIIFKIADDEQLLLIDTKDLKSMINYVQENTREFAAQYGKMSPASLSAILRAVVALEIEGGDKFFGETALNIGDWLLPASDGRGMVHILDSRSLINNSRLYSTFLLWLLSELFEVMPEVGDLDRPRLVFFFDEAHLLFKDVPSVLLDKIEQVVKLIRSKGVGVYFCTQNPRDIPDGVLAQLGNRIQHTLRAYTPAEQKAVKAAAESFRENPAFNTLEVIKSLGTGEAVVSFLNVDGVPEIAQRVSILPPQSKMGSISVKERISGVEGSALYVRYEAAVDPDSAYEFLMRRGLEEQKAREEAEAALAAEKEAEKQAQKEQQERERLAQRESAARKRAAKSVGNSVAGTVGREVGKSVGSSFGSFGKKLGGNVGASLGRGIMSTLFKS